MANDATIIVGKLNNDELEKSIDKLVKTVNDKMLDAADAFDTGVSLMEQSLKTFAQNAKTTVNDIKQAFNQLGTTFNDFAKAMAKATSAANGAGSGAGGRGGAGGSGSSGSNSGSGAAAGTIGALKEEIVLQGKKVDEQLRGTAAAQQEVDAHRKLQQQLKEETKSTEQKNREQARTRLNIGTSMPTSDLDEANRKLRMLETIQRRYAGTTELSIQQQNRLTQAINRTKAQIERLKPAQPPTMAQVLGMDEKSVEAVSRKMAALKRVSIDPNNTAQVRQLGNEYQRLSRLQAEMLGKNVQLTHSNNYLAQSFGYIRNRIVYAFTLGAITNFTKKLYEVRGEYEMLERSLGILVNSMEKGTQIFNELNQMALKSPFTLIELGTAAKQLTAYNFTAEEVVDTTRRLADISAALGVPMERLTYNLGQIKAQGVLTARDARDFANAGLAIVPMLAQMYTETKRFGDQTVTTAQVYDMMSKKMVSYRDVLNVLYKVTDEGGKFFDFQAKQAGTLKVQIANLNLAFNNMLNDIGTEQQAALSKPLQAMRWVFQNWREIYKAIQSVIVILGVYKAQAMLAFTVTKIEAAYAAFMRLGGVIGMVTQAMRYLNLAIINNPMGALAAAVASLAAGFVIFRNSVEEASEDIENFGDNSAKAIHNVDTYFKILNGVNDKSKTYKDTIQKLNEVLADYGIETIKEGENLDNINKKREKAIELIQREGVERQLANQMAAGNERYEKKVDAANQKLLNELRNAQSSQFGFMVDMEGVQKNAEAISQIVGQIVQENVSLIANKTGKEYKKGMDTIFKKIQEEMKEMEDVAPWVNEQWLSDSGFLFHSNIIQDYIDSVNAANEANIRYTKEIKEFHDRNKNAIKSTMTLTEKIAAYERALQGASDDTYKLYNNIASLVKDYAKAHNIDFNVRFHAQVPPEWMRAKDLPELQALAKRFAALAQAHPNGANVNGTRFSSEELWKRSFDYATVAKEKEDEAQGEAAREKQRQKEAEKERTKQEAEARKAEAAARRRQREAAAAQKHEEDMVAKALKDEISLIKEMQGNYDKLRKAGLTNVQALDIATQGYDKTIKGINDQLTKFGITAFDAKSFAGKDVNQLLSALKSQLATLLQSGKVKNESVKALEVEIQKLTIDAKTYNLKKITEGLNNELTKLKEDYELSVELDASPELGDVFADMMGLDLADLPRSFGEAFEKANKVVKQKLDELGVILPDFDLMSAQIQKDEDGKWMGLDFNSETVKSLLKWQTTFRDMFKKNVVENERMLDEYVKKYGDYSDKVAEIESDRLTKIHQLNEAYYNEEMRKRPDYIAKLNAIKQGAQREKGNAMFDEFKNTRLYVEMFENLQYASTATLETMRDKLKGLKKELGTLSPDQLRYVVQQFEKIDTELIQRNPFKGLIKSAKDYTKAIGKQGKQAQADFKTAQRKYDWELGTLATMKEQLEQVKAAQPLNKERISQLETEVKAQEEIVKKRKEELDVAAELNEQYNLMIRLFGQQAQAIGKVLQVVASNLQSLVELRDTLRDTFGVELGANIDATIDGLARVGGGLSQIVSSAQSANVVGVVTGTVNAVAGIGDSIASIFGDGSARTKKFNKRIKESAENVRLLHMAYKDLEHAIDNSLGTAETQTRRLAIANKESELAELEYQMQLEKRKRSKDRDSDAIHEYEEAIADLRREIGDMKEDLVNNLLGSDVKSAAEEFVDTWVNAWKAGETTLDAIQEKMDDMIMNIIKKAATSKIVARLLQPLYDAVDEYTKDSSDGGMELTKNEVRALAELSKGLGVDINEALGAYYGYLEQIGAVSTEGKSLSALQQGIQSITEDTAGALEGYMNGISQQVYLHSDLLTQIRDAVVTMDNDVTMATQAQMLLQLQNNYILMQTMAALMNGWTTPSGQGIRVELIN